MKLRLTNKTHWRTDDLRKLVTAGLRAEGMWTGGHGSYRVEVSYSRASRNWVGGWGYYGYHHLKLHLPKLGDALVEMSSQLVHSVARVLVHEVGHNQGFKHEEMMPVGDIPTPWAEGLQVRRKFGPKKLTTEERVEGRAQKVDAKVAEIERKLELVERRKKALRKRLTTYRQKQRYYRRRAASRGEDQSS